MGLTDMEEIKTIRENTNYKKLSIQVSLNGLSFCILNQQDNKIIYFKKIQFEKQLDPIKVLSKIEITYEQEESLKQPVDEVILLFSSSLFTLVPEELFDEDNAASYLKFNTKILKTDFIAFDKINSEIVNIYIPYANIINYFFDKYGEFEYRHSLSVLIESLLGLENKKLKPQVYLHSHLNSYELIVIENGKLIFANSFEYDTKEDFLYYLLFTAEQLNLDPHEFELILFGEISKDSEEYKIAWNYIKNISFMRPFHSFQFETKSKPTQELSEYLLIKSL
ncbi:DUF3822 family protein [Christiangramia forsetii]|uniref:DUF3822 domain-containing protein n=2 Tax=Christiangramia forsetii TaxID=411153 RepID=A0M2F1_CHRFK|nr:DUF3822 family protein [Christiangramia forsetii]GGG39271.1 hypothetical protein GCM10011532_23810 [Christiangramia forsetii]CAL66796.1 conserved hypothetical protein [Christiangramia forsetii KT0803]